MNPSSQALPKADPAPVRLAHLSDTHLAIEAYRALTPSGENLRALDVVRAFANAVDDICAWDPPLVIHSGDAFDRPSIPNRFILFFRQQLEKLAAIRPDGTRRQVVIIAGNHDQPNSRKEVCALEIFASMPGVSVVTSDWKKIDFPSAGQGDGHPAPELVDVCVTAIPHEMLKSLDFDDIRPRPGYRDVLTTHGVASGSELYLRSLGREYPVPPEVLVHKWSYVALGHYHKQGPVSITGAFATVGSQKNAGHETGRIWYAGSTENCSFRDVRDNGEERGYLRVTLPPSAEELPDVVRAFLPIRAMFRLPVLEAAGLTPEEIEAELIIRIKDAHVSGAIVGQIVNGISRQTWSLVNLNSVRASAADAMHYEVIPLYDQAPISKATTSAGLLGDLPAALEAAAHSRLAKQHIKPALTLAHTLLGKALEEVASEVAAQIRTSDESSPDSKDISASLIESEELSPANSPALAASSDPRIAAARVGRDGKPTTVKKKATSKKAPPAKKSETAPTAKKSAVPTRATPTSLAEQAMGAAHTQVKKAQPKGSQSGGEK